MFATNFPATIFADYVTLCLGQVRCECVYVFFFFLVEGVTREVWLLGKFTALNWDLARLGTRPALSVQLCGACHNIFG